MFDDFKKLLEKKKQEGKQMSPERLEAKQKVLSELRGMANESIGKDLPGLKKVTVASDSDEGLKEGLDKAEEVVEEMPSEEESLLPEEPEMESEEEQPMFAEVKDMVESLSPEDKQRLIQELMGE